MDTNQNATSDSTIESNNVIYIAPSVGEGRYIRNYYNANVTSIYVKRPSTLGITYYVQGENAGNVVEIQMIDSESEIPSDAIAGLPNDLKDVDSMEGGISFTTLLKI